MEIASVAHLYRYPIKSLAAQELERAEVTSAGFAGDRASALIVENPDHVRFGKPLRGKEHDRLHTISDAEAALAAAHTRGVATRLTAGDHYFDAQPVSLLLDQWVRDVERLVGGPLDPLRWRPNIYAHARIDVGDESSLIGATLGAGDVVLAVVAGIGRCVTTTYDVAGGDANLAVLREVAAKRKNTVGVYCTVTRAGTIARGDAIVRL